jgi:hypothetical protein
VTERLVHAVDLLVRVQPEFDRIKGRQHNLTTNLSLTSFLERRVGLLGGLDFWSRVIVFDALIGNTDRHPENWGIIWRGYGSGARCRLSPAYDNGTSLGYEFADDRLAALDDAWVARYIDRGSHHMRLRHDSPQRAGHFQLCADFAQLHPYAVPKMLSCLQLDFEQLGGRLEALTRFDMPIRLAPERRDFMLRLLEARQRRIENAISAVSAQ